MDNLAGITTPLPANAEVVPGLGITTWVGNPGLRQVYAEVYVEHHQPARVSVILTWPRPYLARTCGHCAAPWPCDPYTWAHGVLTETQDHR